MAEQRKERRRKKSYLSFAPHILTNTYTSLLRPLLLFFRVKSGYTFKAVEESFKLDHLNASYLAVLSE